MGEGLKRAFAATKRYRVECQKCKWTASTNNRLLAEKQRDDHENAHEGHDAWLIDREKQ